MAEILALDDVWDATILVAKLLSKQGHIVHTFTMEEDAINYVKNHPVDIAVIDIKLRHMSGIDVLATLKEISPKIGTIMLTGYPTVETARAAMSLGADEYCIKPIDRDELIETVTKVLRKKTALCCRQSASIASNALQLDNEMFISYPSRKYGSATQ